ncbi:hypothetical protein HQN86_18120 [Pedobacter panaciterrae]|jgi:hypothetical protein|uniref:hypothetical protein n=1 Tax=Pedobacter panaciterrae TaxID=363849 RepID=UPI00155DBA42|nr:hypothetical protein [Pedobacter panaciterrae]NQX55543.1 hypothetical protein [Pedobacter panaciterrae]
MELKDEELTRLLKGMEMEEPSMSFTRNVMEQIKLEKQPVALKTRVDNRIIYGIAAIFGAFIAGVFIYAIANSTVTYELPKVKIDLTGAVDKTLTPGFLTAFLFIDVVIALIYFDSILRRKKGKSLQ